MPQPTEDRPAQIEVRRASVADAELVGGLYLRSWLAGYEGLVDPDQLAPVAAERAAYDWPVAIEDPHARFAIGNVDAQPAGVAKVAPDPT